MAEILLYQFQPGGRHGFGKTTYCVMANLKQYLEAAPYRGESYGFAFAKVPRRFWGWFIPQRFLKQNTINGFRRYDLPLLMSYSRSGTNWLRYFMEMVSERPTPGFERYIKGRTDYLIDRAHAAFKVAHRHPKLILVLRDYRECLIRQHGAEQLKAFPTIKAFLEEKYLFQPAFWYIKNIQAFDHFDRPKLLLYYEDLIAFPERELERLADFLEFDEAATTTFFQNIEEHQIASVQYYNKNQKSHTKGKPTTLVQHSEAFSLAERQAFDQYYQNYFPDLFQKYLERYRIG